MTTIGRVPVPVGDWFAPGDTTDGETTTTAEGTTDGETGGPSGSVTLVLDTEPDDRLEGTAATVALAIANGADIVRVHDVKEMARVAKMTDAVVRS